MVESAEIKKAIFPHQYTYIIYYIYILNNQEDIGNSTIIIDLLINKT